MQAALLQCDPALRTHIQMRLSAFDVRVAVRDLQHAAAVAIAITEEGHGAGLTEEFRVASDPGIQTCATSGRRTCPASAPRRPCSMFMAPDKQAALIPAGWFETWAAATLATDLVGSRQTPPVLRAPNGVVADGLRYWSNGVIPWKDEDIRVPVLLVKGEWDVDTPAYMAQALFPKLVSAPYKRYVEIGEGTHTNIMEKNRMALFREVQLFLKEQRAR